MKILVLHLSDIHFENRESFSSIHVEAITKVVKKNRGINTVLIVVSGDIAYSGKREQYNTSWQFLLNLRNKLKENSDIDRVEFAIVPGNHDIDYTSGCLSNKELQEIFEKQEQDEKLVTEYAKVNAFYNHANGLGCFQRKSELVCVKTLNIGDKKLRLNMINTAVFSSLEEDQGLHYLPSSEIEKIKSTEEDEFVFTVMHHPHHWFHSCCKKQFEKELYRESDIIFVGHEHYSSSMDVELESFNVKIYAGGELANRGDWSRSEFYLGILNMESREYEMVPYKWNESARLYISGNKEKRVLSKNRINRFGLYPRYEFVKKMFRDTKYMITEDFSDYYVFPRIEEEVVHEKRVPIEMTELESCIQMLSSKKKVIFIGRSDSGKTVLLKQLFKYLVQSKVVIYVEADCVRSDYEKTIREAFTEIYSADSVMFDAFRQIDRKEKVLLIDDVDTLVQRDIEPFLGSAEEEFDIIVYTCGKSVEVDIKERIRRGSVEEKYTRFSILPFYNDKREELVCRLVKILVKQDETACSKIVNTLCTALSKQKNLFHMDPDFIVQFTKYYCNNIGETIQNDGEIFSKVFEANVVSLIKPYAGKMSVDKILIILDKIAYIMHTTKEYPISQKSIFDVIDRYNQEFDSDVDYLDLLKVLLSAKIFVKEGVDYKFYEKTYLAYFVAREIKRRCMEEGDFSEFEKALAFSCYGINADIVLFVTYITDNLILIRKLMQKAHEYTCEWEPFSIAPITIPYLSDVKQLQVKKADERDIAENKKEEVEKEKQLDKKRSERKESVYDYEESELSLLKKMVRGISLLVIISRTLPSFEHMMKREDKEFCVGMIYATPLRVFNIWASEVENIKLELIEEIKEFGVWEYKKEKSEISDNDALNFLRWESITLLMELMNVSIGNATKENTYRFLDAFDYKSSEIYQIEHLMGLEHRGATVEFIKEIEILYENQKETLLRVMLQRVAKHFILTSKKIQRAQIQRLNSKLWDGQLNNAALLLAKDRNKKKE